MLSTVIAFALITAIFEAVLLFKFTNAELLQKRWFRGFVHIFAITANLVVHWGTIVGTMTAITAGLVSFITLPFVLKVLLLSPEVKVMYQSLKRRLV